MMAVALWLSLAAANASPDAVAVYDDPVSTWTRRQQALIDLAQRLPAMDDAERAVLHTRLADRVARVRRWRDDLLVRLADPALPLSERETVARDLDLLAAEEATLVAQLSMVPHRPGPATQVALRHPDTRLPPVPRSTTDRVRWGRRTVVGPDERVRHAIAIGGDVLVFGAVDGMATAWFGNVVIARHARVDGEVVALGGAVHRDPDGVAHRQDVPRTTTAAGVGAALGGGGLLALGLAPGASATAGATLLRRPVRSLVRGVAIGSAGLGLAAFLVLAGWTAPLGLAVVAALAAGSAIGVAGGIAAATTGGRLATRAPLRVGLALAAAVATCAAAVGATGLWGAAVIAMTGAAGLGASLSARRPVGVRAAGRRSAP